MKKKISMSMLPCIKMIAAAAIIGMTFVTGAQAQDNQGSMIVATITATATVTKIDQKTRNVTIKTDDGQTYSFVASSAVKNLAQVKKGDKITVQYAESVAYQVRKHGTAALTTTDVGVAAAPGEKPAGVVAQQTMLTVTITAIDPSVPSVTLKGPKGNTRTIKVKDPQKLQGVKVGDVVDITYTEAVAVKVDEVTKK